MAHLYLVYGFVLEPSMEIIDLHGLISFDHQTHVVGALLERRSADQFIEITPSYFDDLDDMQAKFDQAVNKLVAQVVEVEGDLVTSEERHRWERKLRLQKPRLLFGVQD